MLIQTAGLAGILMLGLLSAAEAPLAPSVGLGFGDEELALFEELPVVVWAAVALGKSPTARCRSACSTATISAWAVIPNWPML